MHHAVDELAEQLPFLGRKTVEKISADGETAVLQPIGPATAGRRDLHKHFTPDPATAMQQPVALKPINEPNGSRMSEPDDSGNFANARRRIVGGGDQRSDSRRSQIIVSSKCGVGDSKGKSSELIWQVHVHVFSPFSLFVPVSTGDACVINPIRFSLINEHESV